MSRQYAFLRVPAFEQLYFMRTVLLTEIVQVTLFANLMALGGPLLAMPLTAATFALCQDPYKVR
jgi:hypothetical protein